MPKCSRCGYDIPQENIDVGVCFYCEKINETNLDIELMLKDGELEYD